METEPYQILPGLGTILFCQTEIWATRPKQLTFVSNCAPAARCLVARREVAPGIEQGELGSEEETDYATTE
jgi:hypothetical protein